MCVKRREKLQKRVNSHAQADASKQAKVDQTGQNAVIRSIQTFLSGEGAATTNDPKLPSAGWTARFEHAKSRVGWYLEEDGCRSESGIYEAAYHPQPQPRPSMDCGGVHKWHASYYNYDNSRKEL